MDESWRRARGVFAVLGGPPVLWLVAFFLVPLGVIWGYSFGENKSLTEIAINGTFGNYIHAIKPLYLGIILKSFWFAAVTTALCLVVGFPVAIAITFASEKTKAWLLLLIMLPFWTNLLIRTYAIMLIIRDEGLINDSLRGLGLIDRPITILYTNFAILLGLLYSFLPFMVLPLYASLEKLDFRLVEAGFDLYASRGKVLRRIIIPLAKPGIIAGCLLVFIPGLGSYITPLLLGGGGSLMIGNLIALQFGTSRNWPFGSALAFILMAVVLIALMFYARSSGTKSQVGHG